MNRDYLKWAALAFALVATASAEYELARAVGYNQWVAAAVPGALDVWTVRAMRQHRDVLAAVLAMIVVNALSHLVTAGLLEVSVPLVVGVSAIAPLVLYRLHAITGTDEPEADTPAVPEAAEPVQAPVQVDTPAPAPVEPPRPELHVICGGQQPFALDVPARPEPRRLDADEAKAAILQAWKDGLSLAEAAQVATRSRSYVQQVYARLDSERDSARLALVKDEVPA
ncbi:hypothetical protein BU52_10010 [Streptomyces toyocaensis]|uniref:Uncharacterized protein n=1 Tax=Streptomyces toyocaensis TaxID=55952 RepID=A0A081XUV7_STRTO|nr:hypothetical protein [Streptomyces toyocaensis]KES07330.1 hypothetical protein BU52_10010 [Streptomyces toyocaensis]